MMCAPVSLSTVVNMKSLLITLFALGLAACADYGNLGRERASDLASPIAPVSSETKSTPHKSLLARAEVPKKERSETINPSLMQCVSDACKAQCAPRHEAQSRPKWCMYFKEPE
jgi:hypothetical protein